MAVQSQTIKHTVENGGAYKCNAGPGQYIKAWDADFLRAEKATLFDLVLTANYLKLKNLLELTCEAVALMIKGKTPEEEEIRM